MIEGADLRAAVAAGKLTEAQAASLTALAEARCTGRTRIRRGDEPFELFRGFNEIFIVAGLGILGLGWFGIWSFFVLGFGNFRTGMTIAGTSSLVVIAWLAEYFVRYRRMVAPAIVLTLAWGLVTLTIWGVWTGGVTLLGGLRPADAAVALAGTMAATFLFWMRYRVPFAMAILALAGLGALILTLTTLSGRDATFDNLFDLNDAGPFAVGTLAFGLVLFGIAMWFDMGDPHRISLRSSNGFWLHLVAAPAIVNTVAPTLVDRGTVPSMVALSLFLCLIATVAVIIDRRSFLIAAMGYVVALAFLALDGPGISIAILILGAALVGLGAGWQRVRAFLLRPLPEALCRRLPASA